jgi:hypothetical protein
MSKFRLLDSCYATKEWKRYAIFYNDKPYHFKKHSNAYLDNNIYIDKVEETIENILFSVEIYYYYEVMVKYCQLPEEEFITKFNICQGSLDTLHLMLISVYKKNKELITCIDNKISNLFSKNISDIIYEKSITNENFGPYMIRIGNILNTDITIDRLLLDLYEYELSQIDKNIFNITIDSTEELIKFHENTKPLYTNEEIIRKVKADFSNEYKEDIIKLYSKSIYDYINRCDYNEEALKIIYEVLDIKYVKITIDNNNHKLKWILEKLNLKPNMYIPYDYLPTKLDAIIDNNMNIDNIIDIKYNTDDSDQVQMNTYLIDELHKNIHLYYTML